MARTLVPSVIFLLVLSSCLNNHAKQRVLSIDSMRESGSLGKCSVSIASVYCWRDWQPIVEKPGKDGGSPLYLKSSVQVDNSGGPAGVLSWDAYVLDVAAGSFHRVELIDKTGATPWDGRIPASQIIRAELMTHDGPYLNVGGEVILVLCLQDRDGHALWLKSQKSQIERTD